MDSKQYIQVQPTAHEFRPARNAVIIEFVTHQGENGEATIQPVVTIECRDQAMMPMLMREARRLQN